MFHSHKTMNQCQAERSNKVLLKWVNRHLSHSLYSPGTAGLCGLWWGTWCTRTARWTGTCRTSNTPRSESPPHAASTCVTCTCVHLHACAIMHRESKHKTSDLKGCVVGRNQCSHTHTYTFETHLCCNVVTLTHPYTMLTDTFVHFRF